MAKEIKPLSLPPVQQMPAPPDARIIPLERQTPLTHAQVEQVRFGLGDTGPLAQAMLNANVPAVMKQLTIGAVSCLSTRKPADPVVGQMIFETDTQQVKFWNGTLWVTPANSTPTGSLNPFAGPVEPTGWLLCDGRSLLRANYPALFAVIKTNYGSVDATHFNIPDMQGNVPVGVKSTQTSNPDISALAKAAGTYTKTLAIADLPSHDHSMTHTHGTAGVANGSLVSADHLHATVGNVAGGFKAVNTATLGGSGLLLAQTGSTSATRDAGYTTGAADRTLTVSGVTAGSNSANTGSTGGATAVSLVQPSLALNYIIKT
ncbi:MdpB Microcystin-dependent protein [uncultured Caudovirales phage]|uniref:MdpB Microcystin-dependent protein n=1 Tax=uncultured Caudovirales phage TaxID=2100421 RepID=A0A6J5QSS9_9CAUD|nr:MdpB Microcystin-dependent protein [uncultured Caudovirales phage]